ncbi:glutamate receptor 3.6-like [Silene latifolia]|uniref:glutamate receptor 3.6-like n=1 Tax=Silene latifolia TaxID=37657 RepID=UPI003D789869
MILLRVLRIFLLMGLIMKDGVFNLTNGDTNSSLRPKLVNIGAISSSKSAIGRVVRVAIQAAVDDINSSPDVLHGTKLNVSIQDSKFSGFLGFVEAMRLMEKDVVAIIGPESSVLAHMVALLAGGLQVPLVSYAASDPTLTSLQYPYFVRMVQSDLFQMTAIAEIVYYFGWRQVTVIYNDDDYGRNGIASLGDKLEAKQCSISYKAIMNPDASREEIMQVLFQVSMQESRILVLHTYGTLGMEVLNVANSLQLLDSGYVWIATSWLTDVIDTYSPLSSSATSDIQGLLTLRMHTPQSQAKTDFMSRWSDLVRKENSSASFGLNTYGLYAYDTVWILARALDEFFKQGNNISFSNNLMLSELPRSNLHLDTMNMFDGGDEFLSNILRTNMTGLTGQIRFDSDRNLINPAFDILNIAGTGHNTIGYWSNSSGLTIQAPEVLSSKPSNQTTSSPRLFSVIWPGQTTDMPRGWAYPTNGKLLRIGVPRRVVYREFVSYSPRTDSFSGFCLDVFTSAVNLLPYALPYKLVPFGNGTNDPNINDLVDNLSAGVFDAVIGDVAITTSRTMKADFTQPYIESGLVVVANVKAQHTNAWAFMRPFSPMMWGITAAFFIVVGCVVWILEHRLNDEFRGPPKKQIATILWFSCSTWFFAHRENTVSTLGRLVLIIWLFVVLIINSSYTASLTSMLTVQQLSSPVKDIHSLIASDEPIGYRDGSYAYDYLKDELKVPASHLISLKSEEDCAEALLKGPKNGGIAALVDKSAYMELFLSTRCQFSVVGQEFTKNGWGFAFPRDSPLATDMSTAILKLSENGDLQRIHDKWLLRSGACSSQDTQLTVDRLELRSFWGLFLIISLACVVSLIVYFGRMMVQFINQRNPPEEEDLSGTTSRSSRLHTFLTFADEKEDEAKRRVKKRQVEDSPTSSSTPGYASDRGLVPMSLNGSRVNHMEMEISPARSITWNDEVLNIETYQAMNRRS